MSREYVDKRLTQLGVQRRVLDVMRPARGKRRAPDRSQVTVTGKP